MIAEIGLSPPWRSLSPWPSSFSLRSGERDAKSIILSDRVRMQHDRIINAAPVADRRSTTLSDRMQLQGLPAVAPCGCANG